MTLLHDLTGASPGMTGTALLLRLSAIGAALAGTAGTFAYAGGWLSPGQLTPARIIDRFEQVNGPHPGFRRNHAKGMCVAGRFTGNGAGARLSKAGVFAAGRVTPVEGRVALAGGQPYAADAAATVRSLALRFRLPDGEEWRTGMNNIPVFPVRTPEAFYAQLLAAKPDPATGKPDPVRLKAFFADHPESAKAAALIKARTVTAGFADSTYWSLNAFRFVAADGAARPVRWALVPDPGSAVEAAPGDTNALFDALAAQLAQGPRHWHLIVTLGQATDPTADATRPWPADRETVDVGTLTLTAATPEAAATCRDVNFDPLVLPDGIAPSDDPLLSARSAAYARSVTRRSGEAKTPSAVTGAAIQGAAL